MSRPSGRGPREHGSTGLLAALLMIPLATFVARLPIFPTSEWVNGALSLSDLPPSLQGHAELVLFVPFGAIVVCLFRLTLGLRVLSFFRPILTAVAFRMIGVPLGLAILVVVLAGIVLIKPLLKGAHYYVRVPLVLSLGAVCLVVPLMLDRWWHVETLRHISYFPLINLALMCEGFMKKLNRRGLRAALWPTLNAVLAAVVITLLAGIPGAMQLLLEYPEVLLAEAGVILMMGQYLDLHLFAGRNPFMPRRPAAAAALRPSSPPAALEVVVDEPSRRVP